MSFGRHQSGSSSFAYSPSSSNICALTSTVALLPPTLYSFSFLSFATFFFLYSFLGQRQHLYFDNRGSFINVCDDREVGGNLSRCLICLFNERARRFVKTVRAHNTETVEEYRLPSVPIHRTIRLPRNGKLPCTRYGILSDQLCNYVTLILCK